MALTISGTSNGKLGNLSLSANTGDILDSANTTFFSADMWRLSATLTAPNAVITTNLERVDDASFGRIGTGMTESSGIFTFPSTGIYLVMVQTEMAFRNTDGLAVVYTEVTQDNSAYDIVSRAGSGGETTTDDNQGAFSQSLVDVTDVSNVKVRFRGASFRSDSGQETYLTGLTGENITCFSFIRLGDT